MPTYEFSCPSGHVFEKFFRKISDSVPTLECPTCGAVGQRRVSGGAGLLFKGSGFYITDYGKDGKKDQKSSARPATSSTESGAAASETTPKDSGGSDSASKSESKDSGNTTSSTDKGSGKSGDE